MKLRATCIVIKGLVLSVSSYAADYTVDTTLPAGYSDTTISISNGAKVEADPQGVGINNTGSGSNHTIFVNNGQINLGSGSILTTEINSPNALVKRAEGIYVSNTAGTQTTSKVTTEGDLDITMNVNTPKNGTVYGIYTDSNNNGSEIFFDLKGLTKIEINNNNTLPDTSGQLNGIGLTNSVSGTTVFNAENLEIDINDNNISGNYVGLKFKNDIASNAENLTAEYDAAKIIINADTFTNSLGVFVKNAEVSSTNSTEVEFTSNGSIGTTVKSGLSDDLGVHGIKVNNTGHFEGNTLYVVMNAKEDIGGGTVDTAVSGVNVNGNSTLESLELDIELKAEQNILSAVGLNVDSGSTVQNDQRINITIEGGEKLVAKGINVDNGQLKAKEVMVELTGNGSSNNDFGEGLKGIVVNSTGNGASVEISAITNISLTQQSNGNGTLMTGIELTGVDSNLSAKNNNSMSISLNGSSVMTGINVSASASTDTIKNLDLQLDSLVITADGTDADALVSLIKVTDGRSEITTENLNLYQLDEGNPTFKNLLAVDSTGGEITINVTDQSDVVGDINVDNSSNNKAIVNFNTTGEGGHRFEGNIVSRNGGEANIDLQFGKFIGATSLVNDSSSNQAPSIINLTLSKGMLWDMTESSQLTSLDLSNSVVNFKPTTTPSILSTNTLKSDGGSTFNMKVDMGAQTGDKLIIGNNNLPMTEGSSSGAYNLVLANNGSAITNGSEIYNVVEDYSPVANANATFTSAMVEQGGFEYGLSTTTNAQGAKVQQLSSTNNKTSSANAAVSFLNTNYLLSYIELQTLFQRMGELRSTQGQEGDFWLRSFAGKLNSFSTSHSLQGFHMNYTGLQAGIDKLITVNSGDVYLGVMAGYTDADPRYGKGGSGGVRDVNLGLYGTFIHNSGLYVDGVIKYQRVKNNFSVKDTLGQNVNGKSKSNGYSLSLESGKRFYVNQSPFYLEPQAQIVYTHQKGDTVNASNGLKVKLGSYNSLIGGAKVAAGYDLVQGDNPVSIQVKSGYVREFEGSTSYHLNTTKEKYKFRGGWVESSVGVSAQIKKNHNIYSEVSYASGSRFDKRQINLGYRFQF